LSFLLMTMAHLRSQPWLNLGARRVTHIASSQAASLKVLLAAFPGHSGA
jgi:hypothetical protein